MTTRINLLSSPRNISTALMYSFAQRPDCQVVDEPLYAAYLKQSGAAHPGRDEILSSQSQDANEVLEQLLSFTEKPLLFIKNMAYHVEHLDWAHLRHFHNVLFIRPPRQIIASYAQVMSEPNLADIGIEAQVKLLHFLQENSWPVTVLDAAELLKNPEKVLKLLCESTGISFEPGMLSWQAGSRPEDGVWAPYWYSNVHQSTGFRTQSTSSRPLPSHLEPLAEKADRLYEQLLPFSIKS